MTYLALTVYVVFSRIFLPSCNCNAAKQDCEKVCVTPFWALRETNVDIAVLVGQSLDRRELVWSTTSHSISEKLKQNISFPIPVYLSNKTENLFMWVVFKVSGATDDIPTISLNLSIAERRSMVRRRVTRNLLDSNSSSSPPSAVATGETNYVLHWKYSYAPVVIRHVQIHNAIDARTYQELLATPMAMRVWKPTPATDMKMQKTRRMYDPVLWLDDLSITTRHYAPFKPATNESIVNEMQIELQVVPTAVIHYFGKKIVQLNMGMLKSMVNNDEALDELRYYLSEDKMLTMLLTQVIGWVHITLEYLAFQDDWKFFRGKKSFKGISASSLVYSVVRSIIIFLYLHHQETSWLVLGTLAKDIVYESWKLIKIFQPTPVWYTLFGFLKIPINLSIRNLSVDGDEEERKCSVYDHIATLHAGLCLCPIIVGMSLYYLKTYTYTSWYSWFISSAVDCVYFFGFLAMLPQLYINFKLRSVAHLPVKSFMYKIFNTFVDDAFAFIVKMPLKHKIMTLRDDLVFFGFMYQWWIYPADKTRTNEFGFQYDENSGLISDSDEIGRREHESASSEVSKKERNELEMTENEIGIKSNED